MNTNFDNNSICVIIIMILIVVVVVYFNNRMKSITPPPPTQYQNEAYTLSTDIESSKTITTNNFTVSSSGWAEFSKNIYPIGSVYITFEDIKPANIFGGTWELLKGGIFLCSTTENPGDTGGAETHTHKTKDHTLTIVEMPKHNHTLRGPENITGNPDGQTDSKSTEHWGYQYWRGRPLKQYTSTGSKDVPGIEDKGDGKSHNHGDTEKADNIPPYIKVYMWKRTA